MVLHFVDQRETAAGFAAILDLEVDQNVFAHRTGQQGVDRTALDLQGLGLEPVAVKNGGHGLDGLQLFNGVAPEGCAARGLQTDLIRHKGREIRQFAH